MNTWSSILGGCIDLIYPQRCLLCSQHLPQSNEDVFCIECQADLLFLDFQQFKNNLYSDHFKGRVPIERSAALLGFVPSGHVQKIVHLIKYGQQSKLAYYMGRHLGRILQETDWLRSIDVITPVPIHWRRKLYRGYNQSLYIAKGISDVTHLCIAKDLLKRKKYTMSQTGKTRIQRCYNMKSAIAAGGHLQDGQHILLVDDVTTTGATLEACALALLEKKKVRVSVASLGLGGLT